MNVFTNRRTLVSTLFGFSSSLPLPLVMGTLEAWMASEKVDLQDHRNLFARWHAVHVEIPVGALARSLYPALSQQADGLDGRDLSDSAILTIALMGSSHPVHAPWRLAFIAVVVAFLGATRISPSMRIAPSCSEGERAWGRRRVFGRGTVVLAFSSAGAVALDSLRPHGMGLVSIL